MRNLNKNNNDELSFSPPLISKQSAKNRRNFLPVEQLVPE